MDLIMNRALLFLLTAFSLLAQQTVNNFTVKTNLTVIGSAVGLSVDTVSELISLNPVGSNIKTVSVARYSTNVAVGVGAGTYVWAPSYSGTTNAYGGALAVTGGAWVMTGNEFDVEQFGATPDDDSDDDQPAIESAFNFIPAGSTLRIAGGVYDLGQRVSLNSKSNWNIAGTGGTLRIKNPITTASVTVMDVYAATNCSISGLTIDGNGWTGINGIGIGGQTGSSVSNLMVSGVIVKNVTRAPADDLGNDVYGGGGRGITAQFNCYNVTVTGCIVTDSTTGFDVHGNATYPIRGISFVNNVADHCEEGASFYDLLDGNGFPSDVSGSQVMVSGLTMLNCGLSTSDLEFGSWPTGTQGGAIVLVRSRGIQMDGVKLWNDPGYGVIGAVIRGTGKYVNISDLDARADVVSAVWLYKAENTLPLNSATDDLIVPDSFVVSNFRFAGTATNMVRVDQPTSPAVQNSRFEIISDSDVVAFVGGSGSLVTGGDSSVLTAYRRTSSSRVSASFNQLVALANDWTAVPSGGLIQQASVQNQLSILQTNSTPTLRLKRVGTSSGEVRMGVVGAELRTYNSGGSTYVMSVATTGGGTVIEPGGISGSVAASSVLDLRSTSKGLLPPRMTTAQRTAIASPATGLVVYDTTLSVPFVYDSSSWVALNTTVLDASALSYSGGTNITVTVPVLGAPHVVNTLATTADTYVTFSGSNAKATGELILSVSGGPHDLSFAGNVLKPASTTIPLSLTDGTWNLEWKQRTIGGTNFTMINVLGYDTP